MKKTLLLITAACALSAQTARYPSAIASDSDLTVQKDRAQSTLTGAITSSATGFTVVSGSKFTAGQIVTIENEQALVCSVVGNTVNVGYASCPNVDGRGYGGTSASSHANGALVSGNVVSWNHNALKEEVKAIETALGTELSNVAAIFPNPVPVNKGGTNASTAAGARTQLGAAASGANSDISSLSGLSTPLSVGQGGTGASTTTGVVVGNGASPQAGVTGTSRQRLRVKPNVTGTIYEFADDPIYRITDFAFSQTPGGSLLAGGVGQSVTLTPCPLGVAGADSNHYVYLSGGTGTAESVLITGGTCTSGASSGTVTLTPANAHSGSWSLATASAGIQEAINAAAAAGGATVEVPTGTYTTHATIAISGTGISLIGRGIYGSVIQRTEDYGDTFSVSANSLRVSDLHVKHVINYVSGGPGSISNPITGHPDSAHFRVTGNTITFERVRMEHLAYGIVISTANPIYVKQCQFVGIWDRNGGPQMTKASIQVNAQTYGQFSDNLFFGYGRTGLAKSNVGPKYMMDFRGCEDCEVRDGSMGGANYSNLAFFPTSGGGVLMNVRVHGIKFDGAYDSDVLIQGDGSASASQLRFYGNHFNGENVTDNGFVVADPGSGSNSAVAWGLQNNDFQAYLKSAVSIMDGLGWTVSGNSIRSYNQGGGYSTQADASGIYIGGRGNYGLVANNQLGGGQTYAVYGSGGNYCKFGLSLANGATTQNAVQYRDNEPPYYAAVEQYTAPTFGSRLKAYPGIVALIGNGTSVAGAVNYACLNEAGSANIPCEFRGSSYWFGLGPTSVRELNYIASETGSNNAIAGALSGVSLTAGLRVTIKLAHTLQAGANTFNYNAGGAVAIKSSRNVANNIGTAYAATGTVSLQYDGTQWVDVSQ
jgi:hypothetical protein